LREFEDLIDTLDVCDADDLTDLSIEADIPDDVSAVGESK